MRCLFKTEAFNVGGKVSSGNRVVISNGGALVNSNGYVGYGGANNLVCVTGSGSIWRNRANLNVGYGGYAGSTGNSLVLSNGGAVFDVLGLVAAGNKAIVTGGGSHWSNSSSLLINCNGGGKGLEVSNGGRVDCGYGSIVAPVSTPPTNPLALVWGNGSVWNSSSLSISGGGASGFPSLVISNGGAVLSGFRIVVSGKSNVVTVTGPGSLWDNSSPFHSSTCTLIVGDSGAVNSLVITNGGEVMSDYAILGQPSDVDGILSTNNTVLVTGSGSVWSNRYDLYVGGLDFNYNSIGNRLVISDGGHVFDHYAYVGSNGRVTSGSNSVLVTGSGSLWRNGYIFVTGGGSTVVISNGACVVASSAHAVGAGPGGFTVSGGSFYVTNSGGTGVFDFQYAQSKLDSGTITADTCSLFDSSSSFVFNAGVLNCKTTTVQNARQFIVGNGTNSATFRMLGGVHSFYGGLRLRTNSFLTGCGTINGAVLVDAGGTVLADACGTLTLTGGLTNNGVMIADNGSALESSSTLVNNGKILLFNGGTANFTGTFINNGMVVDGGMVLLNPQRLSNKLVLNWTNAGFSLQAAPDISATFTNVPSASSPYTNPATAPREFFRLKMN